jgi:hypothetical protein
MGVPWWAHDPLRRVSVSLPQTVHPELTFEERTEYCVGQVCKDTREDVERHINPLSEVRDFRPCSNKNSTTVGSQTRLTDSEKYTSEFRFSCWPCVKQRVPLLIRWGDRKSRWRKAWGVCELLIPSTWCSFLWNSVLGQEIYWIQKWKTGL